MRCCHLFRPKGSVVLQCSNHQKRLNLFFGELCRPFSEILTLRIPKRNVRWLRILKSKMRKFKNWKRDWNKKIRGELEKEEKVVQVKEIKFGDTREEIRHKQEYQTIFLNKNLMTEWWSLWKTKLFWQQKSISIIL